MLVQRKKLSTQVIDDQYSTHRATCEKKSLGQESPTISKKPQNMQEMPIESSTPEKIHANFFTRRTNSESHGQTFAILVLMNSQHQECVLNNGKNELANNKLSS